MDCVDCGVEIEDWMARFFAGVEGGQVRHWCARCAAERHEGWSLSDDEIGALAREKRDG